MVSWHDDRSMIIRQRRSWGISFRYGLLIRTSEAPRIYQGPHLIHFDLFARLLTIVYASFSVKDYRCRSDSLRWSYRINLTQSVERNQLRHTRSSIVVFDAVFEVRRTNRIESWIHALHDVFLHIGFISFVSSTEHVLKQKGSDGHDFL